ncbi:aminoglycoside phosphotransferase family protein [Streptomyces griseorubiginosus]|uniref:aminoglycoside phosphotransferase family protein n=1 Tax=Streptomyces griseorubiginosus TaxID=67304 RepID=UPI001AD738B6|nr:aminoglycoside phosphotransferase family protein [Streptomyces griseorubiginosus]MBO4252677.1 phosphotransferase [Streptomyces griseorubiginosus]
MNGAAIDEDLVRSLLREQHPDLAELGLRRVPAGWDNQLWRLGEELAVRLPRTERAPSLLRKEYRWLPLLAGRLPLPLPVPTPVRLGEPSPRFQRSWTVARWVPGEPADRVPVSRGRPAAEALAGFLRALHQPAPADAPRSADRGVLLRDLRDEFERMLEPVAARVPVAAVRCVWEEALSAPAHPGPAVWLHADLHPANAVVGDGTLTGVIDFGDLCAGDPATDLAAAWMLLPAGVSAAFFEADGGGADEATIRRARGWAVLRALGLIGIGQAWERGLPGGQRTWGPAGRAILERLLVRRT